jgi:hypothetical protein
MNLSSNNCQSRWGYHPCDYQLFCKLRLLHKWYWRNVYDFHRWLRWSRRLPHNRQGAEPTFCAVFVFNEPTFKPVLIHNDIVDLYREARTPQPEPVVPWNSQLRNRISTLYSVAAEQMMV